MKGPPLAAIRAFEAVGRTGSVNLAAMELGVTSGAITQHVHTLEKHVGRRLVERSGRGIDLTVWGKLYLPRLTLGFAEIRKGAGRFGTRQRSHHLVISTYPVPRHQVAGAAHVPLESAASGSHRHDRRGSPGTESGRRRGGLSRLVRRTAIVTTRATPDYFQIMSWLSRVPALLARVGTLAGPERIVEMAAAVGRLGQ